MSQEFFEEVLGQHIVHMMHEAKMGTHESSYFSAYEDFAFEEEEPKLAEPTEYEGTDQDAEEK